MDLANILFYGLIYSTFFILAALIPMVGFGTAIVKAQYVVFALLGVLFWFSLSTWGQLVEERTIYSRGTGILPFSFVMLYLWGTGAAVAFAARFRSSSAPRCNAMKYFWWFNLLFLGHIFVGLNTRVSFISIISEYGVINVFNMTVLMFVLLRTVDNEQTLKHLTVLLITSALFRGVFGIVRFAFFGGDPANVYANFERIDVRVSFFDINDSIVAAIAGFYAAWRLSEGSAMKPYEKAFYWLVLIVEIVVIFFSYRRTALGGFFLSALLLFILQPRLRRLPLLLIGSGAGVFGAVVMGSRMYEVQPVSEGLVTPFIYDVVGERRGDIEAGRFGELLMAFDTIRDHWLLGVGPWGEFSGGFISWHFGNYLFVHSGIVHILLKTGIVGALLFLGGLVSYVVFVQAKRSMIKAERRALFEASFAGFLFSIPNLLFGTPIIEIRTMLLLGLIIALPYLVFQAHPHSATVRS